MRIVAINSGAAVWQEVKATLEHHHDDVWVVASPSEAIDLLRDKPIDSVLLDLLTLEQFGLNLVGGLRRIAAQAAIAIIDDGNQGQRLHQLCLRAGIDGAVPLPKSVDSPITRARLGRLTARRKAREQSSRAARDRRVLLATATEDQEISLALQTCGYTTLRAHTALAALEYAHDTHVHVAVVELGCPKLDAEPLISALLRRDPHIVVLAIAASSDVTAITQAVRDGAHEVLVAPLSADGVVEAVHQAWNRWSATGRLTGQISLAGLSDAMPYGVVCLPDSDTPPILNHFGRAILALSATDATPERIQERLGFRARGRCCGDEGPAAETRSYRDRSYLVQCRCIQGEGEHLGTAVLLRDVTGEAALDDHKNEFASVVSHELRTPLTAIKNALDILIDNPELAQASKDRMLTIAHRNNERMMVMVRDLLDLSRLEAGHRALTLSESNLMAIVKTVNGALEQRAEARTVTLRIEAADNFSGIYVDTVAIERVLLNLVSNAIKYTREGTEVVVRLQRENEEPTTEDLDPRAIVLRSFAVGWVRFEVIDAGFGVPHAEKGRIFKKFVRIDRKVYGKSSGTGLGLSIAERLVQAHGGNMWLTSTPGKGATFGFRVPVFDRHGAFGISLANRVQDAKRGHWSLGIVVLHMLGATEQRLDVSDALGERLVESARSALYRARDFAMFVPHRNELILLLEGCLPEALPRARARVAKVVKVQLEEEFGSNGFHLAYGNSFSPPDGSIEQAVSLLARAREHAHRHDDAPDSWEPRDDAASWNVDEGPTSWNPVLDQESVSTAPPPSVEGPPDR